MCATTPSAATISGRHASNPNYYSVRYISGTLEVTKLAVSIRIEPDRWTGNVYDGTSKKAGFTNDKTLEEYVQISNQKYKDLYLNTIWETIKGKSKYDASATGLKYYLVDKTDAGDYTESLDIDQDDANQKYRPDEVCNIEREACGHDPRGKRRADVGSHDDGDGLRKRQKTRIYKGYGHHRSGCRRLDGNGDKYTCENSGKAVGRHGTEDMP